VIFIRLPKNAAGREARYAREHKLYDTGSGAAPKSGGFIGLDFLKVNLAKANGINPRKAGNFRLSPL
jgi:hypothetical protein